MAEGQRPGIELFYAYAQEDEILYKKLDVHLGQLVRQYQISTWSHRKILPGRNSRQEIDAHLNSAQIILLLISSSFLASDYCYGIAMQRAIERHKAKQACVIPILLSPADWQDTPFAGLEALPRNGKPITTWNRRDQAWNEVAKEVRSVIEDLIAWSPPPSDNQAEPTMPLTSSPPKDQPLAVAHQQTASVGMERPDQPLAVAHQQTASVGMERPATVFLSYAHEDAEAIKELQLRLNIRGVRAWRDGDDLLAGSAFEREIVDAIEQDVDAIALLITRDFLQSKFIWRVEVAAALRRHKRDPHFHIVPILQGVTFAEVRQLCLNWDLSDLSRFNGILLVDETINTTWEEQNKKWNEAARRILRSALTLRLRRVNADRRYEPWLSVRTFFFEPSSDCLDLDLNLLKLIGEKESLPTIREWEQIVLPALQDVKQLLSEKVPSHRLHISMQGILPVALAVGFVFRASAGVTLLLERSQQGETWSTDVLPLGLNPLHHDLDYNDQGDEHTAVVEVVLKRSIKASVEDTLSRLSLTPAYHVRLESLEAVRDAAHALAIAQQVGRVCQNLCDQQRVTQIHLFVLIPSELAVLIGYQLNALCPVTLYQWKEKERVYQPVGTLS